jgi:hypothetical protein
MQTVSRLRIITALVIAPLMAPILFWTSVYVIDSLRSSPLTPYRIGSLSFAIVAGAPFAYLNAAIILFCVFSVRGERGLTYGRLLMGAGAVLGAMTMRLLTAHFEYDLTFVALGGLAGFVSATAFCVIAFWKRTDTIDLAH